MGPTGQEQGPQMGWGPVKHEPHGSPATGHTYGLPMGPR